MKYYNILFASALISATQLAAADVKDEDIARKAIEIAELEATVMQLTTQLQSTTRSELNNLASPPTTYYQATVNNIQLSADDSIKEKQQQLLYLTELTKEVRYYVAQANDIINSIEL